LTVGLFSAAKKDTRVGVDFLADGIAVAQVNAGRKGGGKIKRCEFVPASGHVNQVDALREWVRAHGLQKAMCVCLLAHDDCDIYQVEKPDVDDAELIQAVTWKIKDLVAYDVSEAVVDSYPMPVSSKNNKQQVGVVAARDVVVSSYVEGIRASGLELVALDVHELVRSNLHEIRESTGQTVALLSLSRENGLLSIYHDSDLYVSRDFKLGLDRLGSNDGGDTAEFDTLLLEVQRSMDYYESYYGLGAVTALRLFPQNDVTDRLVVYLKNQTNFDIDFVALGADNDDVEIAGNCFHAYCAALRGVAQ
jgi:MSHA biogenesis protein MshI